MNPFCKDCAYYKITDRLNFDKCSGYSGGETAEFSYKYPMHCFAKTIKPKPVKKCPHCGKKV